MPSLKIRVSGLALTLSLTLLIASGCSTVPSSAQDKDASYAQRDLGATPLGTMAAELAANRGDDESGFGLLDRGNEALAWRLFMADQAVKTIDAQYFLWKDDRLGRLLIQHLMDAAERGVRVRVIVDDSMTDSDPQYLARFGAHPNVEVRLYKPFGPKRKSDVVRWLDFAGNFELLNRRMHNKLFIVDDSLLIAGGRNIGEDYFEYLAPSVFRSRDLLAVGRIADASSSAFDLFWNSQWTVPIEMAVASLPSAADAEAFRQTLDAAGEDLANYPPGYRAIGSLAQARAELAQALMWGPSRLVFDRVPGTQGEPTVPKEQADEVLAALQQAALQSREEILLESAYLIVPDATLNTARTARERGVKVMALTNSLASNNHTSAFVAYRKQRKALIEGFSGLYEYRPDARSQTAVYHRLAPGQPVPHLGLHAKTAVFDRRTVFVGSFNMDPRSAYLNTEIGLLVESPELAEAVAASILNDMGPGNAWRLRLDEAGEPEWATLENGREIIETTSEPLTPEARKIEADLSQPFTPSSQM